LGGCSLNERLVINDEVLLLGMAWGVFSFGEEFPRLLQVSQQGA
jgi:hypothetical protein